MNSVVNGKEAPIQIQVGDVEKCFDKLWLQNTTNALYEAGLNSDMLNLLFLENRNTKVAVKVNNNITKRINVTNVELQGSVWGSLKCTSSMDTLNQILLPQDQLTYKYKGDNNTSIGVLGMVDDTLAFAECGVPSIQKNSVINSFIETQRLTLSSSKSVVLHIGKQSKCKQQCPTLRVHNSVMKTADSVRYLGDIVSASGSMRPCLEDRRNKGWAKLADISAILSELRETKLHNGILYNSEAWSNIRDKDVERIEQVDVAGLKELVAGHAKCPRAFYYLEFGTLMLRHKIMIRRLIYHHHILAQESNELIRRIYEKQKVNYSKGDWIMILKEDFEFIGEELNEEFIKSTPKNVYKQLIKKKVRIAAFTSYIQLKEKSKKKMKDLHYNEFKMQPYLNSNMFSTSEKQLLFSLRSKCYSAKMNFKKLHKKNLKCVFLFNEEETQCHIFQNCVPILTRLGFQDIPSLDNIYGSLVDQKNAVLIFTQIDHIRKQMISDM